MSGWITIDRSIKNHWVFSDAENLKAWIVILIEVNHSDQKILIGKTVFTCKRGESLNSLETWGKLFGNWGKSRTKRFLDLLKSETMIDTINEGKTTRLSVCNYDKYQGLRNDQRTIGERKAKRSENDDRIQTTMINNENNENKVISAEKSAAKKRSVEERKQDFYNSLLPFVADHGRATMRNFFNYWSEKNKTGQRMKFEMEKTFEIKNRLATWERNGFDKKYSSEKTEGVQILREAKFYGDI